MQVLDHMVRLYLVLQETTELSSTVAASFCIVTAKNESSFCSTSSSAFDVVTVLNFHHSNRYIIVSHCCFNLHFPRVTWSICYTLLCHPYIIFGKVSVKPFGPVYLLFKMILFLAVLGFVAAQVLLQLW